MSSAAAPELAAIGVSEDWVGELLQRMRSSRWTVATAESLTGGLVSACLTAAPGASAVVRGGLVVYATELKTALADVDAALLAEHGAVHPDVAAQLATGARWRCGADWGVGVTGVAGPDPQDGVAPGTVHIGVDGPGADQPRVSSVLLTGGRAAIRAGAVRTALEHLAREQSTTSAC